MNPIAKPRIVSHDRSSPTDNPPRTGGGCWDTSGPYWARISSNNITAPYVWGGYIGMRACLRARQPR